MISEHSLFRATNPHTRQHFYQLPRTTKRMFIHVHITDAFCQEVALPSFHLVLASENNPIFPNVTVKMGVPSSSEQS